MIGYCSNSPLRCENARTLTLLNESSSDCPECKLSLVPEQDISKQLCTDEYFLKLIGLVLSVIMLIAVYIYYVHFV